MSGRDRTEKVTRAVVGWLVKRGFSCQIEVGVLPWGKRRCDIVALNTKRHLIIVEVKQSWADFNNDRKYAEYFVFANQFYFAFPHDLYEKYSEKIIARLEPHVGILVLGKSGHATVVKNSKVREVESSVKRDIVTRLAWRGGLSRRNTRRIRVYL